MAKYFFGLYHGLRSDLIIELVEPRVMLAEPVAGEENVVLLQIGEHAVRPVDHSGFHEGEGALAQGKFFTFVDRVVVPGVGKVAGQVFGAHFGTIQRLGFTHPVHNARQ